MSRFEYIRHGRVNFDVSDAFAKIRAEVFKSAENALGEPEMKFADFRVWTLPDGDRMIAVNDAPWHDFSVSIEFHEIPDDVADDCIKVARKIVGDL